MSDAALKYLLVKEFSAGNGQCPECWGAPPRWFGHPCFRDASLIGHHKDCELATAICEAGGSTVFLGEYHAVRNDSLFKR